ncbi:MFS transporter [Chthonobacter rhizosphaerae]|uniref:MFS transporter n=1 Tax=Chthonobacter rhizosphaerae TaxID=2735553 RepID=UPI0015EEA94D|nr:MFS transporter [Chthonobacter rhizosphaerae]
MAAFFAASYVITGIVIPFYPVFLTDRGFSGETIAFVLAAPHLLRLVTMPPLAYAIDRWADPRAVLTAVAAAMLVAGIAANGAALDWMILLAAVVLMVLMFDYAPLCDAVALSFQRAKLADYGRMRLWGSASFIAANLVGGVALDHMGVPAIEVLVIVGAVLAIGSTFLIPRVPRAAPLGAGAAAVLREPAFLAVLAAGAMIQAAHAGLYGFATLTWQGRGIDESTIGAFWAVGVVAEILMFLVASRIPASVPTTALIAAAGVASAIRWSLFTVDIGVAGTFLLQGMHAFTFAIGHYGMMRFILERVPEERAGSAQSAYVILIGIFMAAGSVIAGQMWERVGPDAFLSMAAFSALGCVVLAATVPGVRRLQRV